MNYIELEIGGKKRGAKLGVGLLEVVLKELNINPTQLDEMIVSNPLTTVPKILYHSLKFNCERAKQEVDFDLYDVMDWCSDVGIFNKEGDVFKFYEAFNSAIIKQLPQDKVEELKGKEKPLKK